MIQSNDFLDTMTLTANNTSEMYQNITINIPIFSYAMHMFDAGACDPPRP